MNEQLQYIRETIFSSSQDTITKIITFWPNVLGALGVVVVGWLVAIALEKFIVKSSTKLRLGWVTEKLGLDKLMKKAEIKKHPAAIIGKLVKGYIFTMFLIGACNIVKLAQIATFLNNIIAYIPRMIVALIIVLIGIQISETVGAIVKGALNFASTYTAEVLSNVARYSIIFFSILAALVNLNIADSLVEILFVGFVTMMALAGGLAMGLGGKDLVREFLESLKEEDVKKLKGLRKNNFYFFYLFR